MIIRASAERLLKGGMKEAGFIVEETDRLNDIVTGYLDFAIGKRLLKKEIFCLSDLLSGVIEQFRPRLARDNIELDLKTNESDINVIGDRTALRQVVINLILNSAEAISHQEMKRITIEYSGENRRAIISVTDNGPGIEKKDVRNIFTPFYTTKTTGSGLGLFHSRKLIEEMGGGIRLESGAGGPTRFILDLPLADKG
jgi:signal transduction histidine kinase